VYVFDSVDFTVLNEQSLAMAQTESTHSSMNLALRRHELIVTQARAAGAVRVTALAAALGVSEMTIRRDLDVLSHRGLLVKVHGGATVRTASSHDEPGFEAKSGQHTIEKVAISRAAARLVAPGTAIGIGAGTTTWRLAQELVEVANLTVVTNAVRVADVFDAARRPDRTVILTGGVRTLSDALVGPVADHCLRSLQLDAVFLGTHGMDERLGFSSPNLAEAETNRVFVQAGRKLYVLADHTKWGISGLSSFAGLHDATAVVTTSALPSSATSSIGSQRLVLAKLEV
jgi:DeoR/GlpR family transcriptional regulator of sugar metabolism